MCSACKSTAFTNFQVALLSGNVDHPRGNLGNKPGHRVKSLAVVFINVLVPELKHEVQVCVLLLQHRDYIHGKHVFAPTQHVVEDSICHPSITILLSPSKQKQSSHLWCLFPNCLSHRLGTYTSTVHKEILNQLGRWAGWHGLSRNASSRAPRRYRLCG